MKVGALLLFLGCSSEAERRYPWYCEPVGSPIPRLCVRAPTDPRWQGQEAVICAWAPGLAADVCFADQVNCEAQREHAPEMGVCKQGPGNHLVR